MDSSTPLKSDLKTCRVCAQDKPRGEFYPRADGHGDGLYGTCRQCERKRREAKIAALDELGRESLLAAQRGYTRVYRSKTPRQDRHPYDAERQRLLARVVTRTPQGQARKKLQHAVERGEIQRPTICQECGRSGVLIQAHHADYSKPFEVDWLCSKCHGLVHRKD